MKIMNKSRLLGLVPQLVLLSVLITFVIVTNAPIISFDLLYPEQPLIYLANQKITSLHDLLNVYLHPQFLHYAIPFFRPSGHFLIYQLIAPIIGWQNNVGFIIVNLIFLALTGYVMIKLYRLLFPKFVWGGYIAFSIYAMHPALSLSRLISLHFEFAYVFFTVLSLYYFVLFYQRNPSLTITDSKVSLRSVHLLASSLLVFVIAATFKEPAVMLGGVFLLYIFMHATSQTTLWKFFPFIIKNKVLLQIILLTTAVTLALLLYLTLPWPTLVNPVHAPSVGQRLATINEFLKCVFGLKFNLIPFVSAPLMEMLWRGIIFPTSTRVIIGSLTATSAISCIFLYLNNSASQSIYKKSIFFLFGSSLIFLFLPIAWAMGLPWHFSLTILCLSMIAGFSCDYLIKLVCKRKICAIASCTCFIIIIGLNSITTNNKNMARYTINKPIYFTLKLMRNAVQHPPHIKDQLNTNSIIISEDSGNHQDLALGASSYPFIFAALYNTGFDYNQIMRQFKLDFIKIDPEYSGNLFKLAYLIPSLREESYPFQIEKMKHNVADIIIYNWLTDRKSTRLNSSHSTLSRMPSSA